MSGLRLFKLSGANGVRSRQSGAKHALVLLCAGLAWAAPLGAQEVSPPSAIPPRLVDAAEQTLESNPALAAARSSIRATGHDIRAAKWLRFPTVAVQAMTRDDKVGISPNVQVFQPIWSGGRISGSVQRAEALQNVAQAQYNETAFDLLLRLSDAFHEIGKGDRLIAVFRESLDEHRRLVESMERRVEQEVSPRSDLELARSRLSQVEQELTLAAAQHDAAARRVIEIVGDPTFQPGEAPRYSPQLHHPAKEGLFEKALTCDPSIQRFVAEAEVAEADRKLGRAATLPQVGVQYAYDRVGGNQVGLALKMEANGGLSSFAAADAAMARRQASEYRISSARRDVQEKVGLDLVENHSSKTRIASSMAAADSTARVNESLLRQFVAGRRTWLDVMNSVRESVAAKATLVQVENSAMASAARLQLRSCTWQPDGEKLVK